jgi:broad specificity phosphatase PhoE
MRAACLALSLLLGAAANASAQEMVYVIRHAEKELSGEDPALTPTGRQRAAAWADMLKFAGLDIVVTSDARRTRETGGIVAGKLGLPQTALPRADTVGLVDALQFEHENENVLIVGHAETIPGILHNLGIPEVIAFSQSEFDILFILFGANSDNPRLVRLRMP